MFWYTSGFFLLLNILDLGITQYLLTNEYSVKEGNGIVQWVIDNYGWTGCWAYKFLVIGTICTMVRLCFKEKAASRVMRVACWVFGAFMVYMVGLAAFVIIGDYR